MRRTRPPIQQGTPPDSKYMSSPPRDELMDLIDSMDPQQQVNIMLYRHEAGERNRTGARVLVDQLDHIPEYQDIGTAYGGGRFEMLIYSVPDRKLLRRHVFSMDKRWDKIANDRPTQDQIILPNSPQAATMYPPIQAPSDNRELMMVLIELIKALATGRNDKGPDVHEALAGLADVGSQMIAKTHAHNLAMMAETMKMRMASAGLAEESDEEETEQQPGGSVPDVVDRTVDKLMEMLKMVLPMFTAANPQQQKSLAEGARQRPDVRAALEDMRTRKALAERVKTEFPEQAPRILEIFGLVKEPAAQG